MKKIFLSVSCFLLIAAHSTAQENFTTQSFDVRILVNTDSSLDVTETVKVHFLNPMHGIYRSLPDPHGRLPVQSIKVEGCKINVSDEGGYKTVKMGDKDSLIDGDQQFVLHYRINQAINFSGDRAELYYYIMGNGWPTAIDRLNFEVLFSRPLPKKPTIYVMLDTTALIEAHAGTVWINERKLQGRIMKGLNSHQSLNLSLIFPGSYFTANNNIESGAKNNFSK